MYIFSAIKQIQELQFSTVLKTAISKNHEYPWKTQNKTKK